MRSGRAGIRPGQLRPSTAGCAPVPRTAICVFASDCIWPRVEPTPARAIGLLEHLPADDVEALNALGVAYGDAGRLDEALATFSKVLTLDPTNGIASQNLGSMALRRALAAPAGGARAAGLQQAETYTRKAIELDPALADAQTTLGVILASSGRKADAIESWKRAVALDDTQFNALYNLWSELAAAGRMDEAVTYGRQFAATAPPAFFQPDLERVRAFLSARGVR